MVRIDFEAPLFLTKGGRRGISYKLKCNEGGRQ